MNIYYTKKGEKVAIQVMATSQNLAIDIAQAMDQALLVEGWMRVSGKLTGTLFTTTPAENLIDVDTLRHTVAFKRGS